MGKDNDNDNDNNKGISRRDALKRMGLFVAGAAALSMPSALTSCGGEKKKRIILYFTATGNSLYIARQLADENTELLSIPQMVKQNRYDFEADEVGIIILYTDTCHRIWYVILSSRQESRLTTSLPYSLMGCLTSMQPNCGTESHRKQVQNSTISIPSLWWTTGFPILT